MPSAYLQGADLTAYGVATAQPSDVTAASLLVDAFLQRPEGLAWAPDASGAPCYMAGLDPTLTFTAASTVAAGTNVVVPVSGGFVSTDLVGDVLVLDRTNPSKTEACVVTAVGQGTLTLASVGTSHTGPVTLDAGLTILEERGLPANRSVARVSRGPLVRVLAAQGRYAYGRRSQQQAGVFAEPSILASVQVFGGPPVWNPIDVTHLSLSPSSCELWVPAGALVATYSDVRLRYVAGYPTAGLPGAVKAACANLVRQATTYPELNGNIKTLQSGGSKIERFADSLLDAETKALLQPFQARVFF